MYSLYRGLLAGLLMVGVVALCAVPADVGAQDKKDKKDPKKGKSIMEEVAERSNAAGTSDGLSLKGYWFQGNAVEKQRPDAVMMFPAPGSKINDSWLMLAKSLSEKNFSVLLLDWRGCGLNGPNGVGAGPGIFADKQLFWNEAYNAIMFKDSKTTVERNGLDYRILSVKSSPDGRGRYRDFMFMNDMMAARFFLDKQSDAGRCNTNRIWIISEKDGAHLGMAFIAAEFQRNTVYKPNGNVFDLAQQSKAAGQDYAGIMALSYSTTGNMSSVASRIYSNALPSIGANERVKAAKEHFSDRLAMVLMYKKGTGAASTALLKSTGVFSTEEEMKRKYKYPKEFDIKGANIAGIDMIDPNDSFGVKDYVVKAMVEISKKQPFGKDPTDREASKMINIPRFEIELFNK